MNLPEKLSVSENCKIKVNFTKTQNQECPRCGGFFIEPKPKDPFLSLDSSNSEICTSCSDHETSFNEDDDFEFYSWWLVFIPFRFKHVCTSSSSTCCPTNCRVPVLGQTIYPDSFSYWLRVPLLGGRTVGSRKASKRFWYFWRLEQTKGWWRHWNNYQGQRRRKDHCAI